MQQASREIHVGDWQAWGVDGLGIVTNGVLCVTGLELTVGKGAVRHIEEHWCCFIGRRRLAQPIKRTCLSYLAVDRYLIKSYEDMMDEIEHVPTSNVIEMTADLIAAYVSNNNVPVSELPAVIAKVHAALTSLGNEASAEPNSPEIATAAQIKKSITPDALISFEDGKSYKTLRRHLTLRGLTAEQYRMKHGLPADYPMTTANYSAQRSALAHSLGLGQKRRKTAATAVEEPATAAKAKGRKKAAERA